MLAKYGIADAVGIEWHQFLANVIQQFKLHVGTPINYVCFLYNYFQVVSEADWENKHKILAQLPCKREDKLFYEWWAGASV